MPQGPAASYQEVKAPLSGALMKNHDADAPCEKRVT
jgi:hypothetical protein